MVCWEIIPFLGSSVHECGLAQKQFLKATHVDRIGNALADERVEKGDKRHLSIRRLLQIGAQKCIFWLSAGLRYRVEWM